MALAPPPISSILAAKDGMTSQAWARWLQQMWDEVRALQAQVDAGVGGGGWDPVYCRAARSTAQTFANNTSTRIDWNVVESDTLGMITTGASWGAELPDDGYYILRSMLTMNGSGTGPHIFTSINDGVLQLRLDYKWPPVNFGQSAVQGVSLFPGNAGDVLWSQFYQATGSSQDSMAGDVSANYIEILKVSNLT